MKRFMLAVAALVMTSVTVHAQDSTSGSAANAKNQNANYSAGTAIVYGDTNIVPEKQTLETAPAVSAPAVFGGGHPCLAGKSGGISVIGGGLSYGQGEPEPACMAWVMGQPEVAIRIMASQSPAFCAAINSVGYYRVGRSILPFKCGKQTIAGGIDSPGTRPTTTRVSARNQSTPQYAQQVCNRDGGKLRFSVDSHFADKASARANCLNTLR